MHAEDHLVSVDDHVVEPPDMFDGRVAAKWKDPAPRGSSTRDSGIDVWFLRRQRDPERGG